MVVVPAATDVILHIFEPTAETVATLSLLLVQTTDSDEPLMVALKVLVLPTSKLSSVLLSDNVTPLTVICELSPPFVPLFELSPQAETPKATATEQTAARTAVTIFLFNSSSSNHGFYLQRFFTVCIVFICVNRNIVRAQLQN
jgi:hypothetical protein